MLVAVLFAGCAAVADEPSTLDPHQQQIRAGTERNLRAIDCADYAVLICKPDNSQETSAAFKLEQRRRLVVEGRKIITNVGDQVSDLVGGYAERTFKLPNSFYLSE
jgi:hypothetical protein